MTQLLAGLYTTDDGLLRCAAWIDPDTFSVMGWTSAPIGTPYRPQQLRMRREVFINSEGRLIRLPYPTTTQPWPFSTPVTVRGDTTYVPIAINAERNFSESR